MPRSAPIKCQQKSLSPPKFANSIYLPLNLIPKLCSRAELPNGWKKQNYRTTARNGRLAATARTQHRPTMPRKLSELCCCRAGGFIRLGMKDESVLLVRWSFIHRKWANFKCSMRWKTRELNFVYLKAWLSLYTGPQSIYEWCSNIIAALCPWGALHTQTGSAKTDVA